MKTLFVYGTLKSGKSRNFYLTRAGARLLREVKTAPRYRLCKQPFVDYPFMVEDADGYSVEGELWAVDDETLETIDAVEGVGSNLFKRVAIELENGWTEGYLIVDKPLFSRDIGVRW